MGRSDEKPTQVWFDRALHEAYSDAARSIGISLPSWLKLAAAAYYAKWRPPLKLHRQRTGHDPAAEGRFCARCQVPAAQCRQPELHQQWDEWVED